MVEATPDASAALEECGASINGDRTVDLWHATTLDKAKAIRSSGEMLSDAYGLIYFATDTSVSTQQDVDALLRVRVPVGKLNFLRSVHGRAEFTV